MEKHLIYFDDKALLRKVKEKNQKLHSCREPKLRSKARSAIGSKPPRSFRKIPQRSWILLYSLHKLEKVPTALKLQKLIFLIQTEGKINGYNFFKHHYGPYSRELEMDTKTLSRSFELIDRKMIEGMNYPYYQYSITPQGSEFVRNVIQKRVDKKHLEVASEIIKKYGRMNHWDLQEYVYKKYVISDKEFKSAYSHVKDDLLSLRVLWENNYSAECPASFLILAILDYSSKSLMKLKGKDDAVVRGVCLASVSELTARLVDLTSICETTEKCPFSVKDLFSEVSDYINFIDHYCSQQRILESISDLDFSDFLNEEELERLEKVLKTTRASELMY